MPGLPGFCGAARDEARCCDARHMPLGPAMGIPAQDEDTIIAVGGELSESHSPGGRNGSVISAGNAACTLYRAARATCSAACETPRCVTVGASAWSEQAATASPCSIEAAG